MEEREKFLNSVLDGSNELSYRDVAKCLSGIFSRYSADELKEPLYETFLQKGSEFLKKTNRSLGEVVINYVSTESTDYEKIIA